MRYFLAAFILMVAGLSLPTTAFAGVCGSGVTRSLVPDSVGFDAQGNRIPHQQASQRTRASGLVSQRVSFSSACQNHDSCYSTQGKRKSECDTAFYRELLASCRSAIPSSAPEQMQRSCINTALLYNDVVRGQESRRSDIWGLITFPFTGQSGCNAYRNAQGNKNASCN